MGLVCIIFIVQNSFNFEIWILEINLHKLVSWHSILRLVQKSCYFVPLIIALNVFREGDHQFAASITFIETFAGSMLTSFYCATFHMKPCRHCLKFRSISYNLFTKFKVNILQKQRLETALDWFHLQFKVGAL